MQVKRAQQRKTGRQPARHELLFEYQTGKLVANLERHHRTLQIKQRIDSLLDTYTTDKDKELSELVNELQSLQT